MRPRSVPLSAGFVAVTTAMLWLSTAIAATALWPVYQSSAFVVLVAVTIVLASAIAILGAVFRWPSSVVFAATVVGFLVFGVPLAVPDRALFGLLPSPDGLADLVTGSALSWKQLLTVTLPVGSYQGLLIPAFVLVLLTVVIGLSTSLRSRNGELGVIGPIVLFIAGIAFGPTRATWPLGLSLGLTAAILLWLIWRRWYRRRASIRSLVTEDAGDDSPAKVRDHAFVGFPTLMSAGLIMALASGVAVGATTLMPPTGSRDVLRAAIVQPFDPHDYPSPLGGFRLYEQKPVAESTMFTVSGLPADARIRIATLDSYDGIVYSVGSDRVDSASGSFTRVPSAFDQSAVSGKQVRVTVTIGDYSGVWLPTIGKFESVDFSGAAAASLRDSFFYNDNTGTAAVVHKLTKGDSYTLRAILPTQPTSEQLSALTPGDAQVPKPSVLPDALSSTLDAYVGDIRSAGGRLAAMVEGIKTHGYVSHGVSPDDPPSRFGHAADRITELLTDQRMIGDQEQYSVTAALMAMQLGFPSRVVFGFVPGEGSTGTIAVRGSDVSAWIEVDTAQFGWVTIDPTPPVREIPAELPQEPTQVARPQSPVQPPPQEQDTHTAQAPPERTQDDSQQPNAIIEVLLAVLAVLGWVAVAVAIVLAPFLTIALAKLRRRVLRRKAPTPVERISGGWQEFEDAVIDHGFSPPDVPTRTEVAVAVGGMRSLVLASVADRAVFAPETSSAADADQVWRSVAELSAMLGDGLTRWQRIKAKISLRSLGGYSVKSLFKR